MAWTVLRILPVLSSAILAMPAGSRQARAAMRCPSAFPSEKPLADVEVILYESIY